MGHEQLRLRTADAMTTYSTTFLFSIGFFLMQVGGAASQTPRYTSACQVGAGEQVPEDQRMSREDRSTLVDYVAAEAKDRPRYVAQRSADVARESACVAVEGRTIGAPWHPNLGMLRTESGAEVQVLFSGANLAEIELWQAVSSCLPPGRNSRPRVDVVGEFGGVRTILYERDPGIAQHGYYLADDDFAGGQTAVIRQSRLRRLENPMTGHMLTYAEWDVLLDSNEVFARKLGECVQEEVVTYRRNIASRDERRQETADSMSAQAQRYRSTTRLLSILGKAEDLCERLEGRNRVYSGRECTISTVRTLEQLSHQVQRECMSSSGPSCRAVSEEVNEIAQVFRRPMGSLDQQLATLEAQLGTEPEKDSPDTSELLRWLGLGTLIIAGVLLGAL